MASDEREKRINPDRWAESVEVCFLAQVQPVCDATKEIPSEKDKLIQLSAC